MRALLCGVRGSTPVSGAEYTCAGGDTSCVAIPATDGRWLVLDAGTGLTRLGAELDDRPLRGTILLTHLHWDHTHGLPFLANADRDDAEVDVRMPVGPGEDAEALLVRAMSPPHFPITPAELRGRWRFSPISTGEWSIEGFTIQAATVQHKGGLSLGFRVAGPQGSLAYVPDHAPRLAPAATLRAARQLVAGVDVLIHGGGFLASEQHVADDYGHATIDDAIDFATEAAVGRLVIVHHSPRRTDAELALIEGRLQETSAGLEIIVGRAGDWIDIAAQRQGTDSPSSSAAGHAHRIY